LDREVEIAIERDITGYLEDGLQVQYVYVTSIQKATNGKIKHFYSEVEA